MIKGKTESGFEFAVAKSTMDNMELVDLLADLESSGNENVIAVSRIANLVLGREQKAKLYEHHRTDDGRVPVEGVLTDISEIFTAFGTAGKNS